MKFSKKIICVVVTLVFLAFSAFPAMGASEAAEKSPSVKGELNINTATVKQLTILPGIGKKTAELIVEYRTQNGNFKTVEELLKVKGVGKKTMKKIKDFVILEGETTLAKMKK